MSLPASKHTSAEALTQTRALGIFPPQTADLHGRKWLGPFTQVIKRKQYGCQVYNSCHASVPHGSDRLCEACYLLVRAAQRRAGHERATWHAGATGSLPPWGASTTKSRQHALTTR